MCQQNIALNSHLTAPGGEARRVSCLGGRCLCLAGGTNAQDRDPGRRGPARFHVHPGGRRQQTSASFPQLPVPQIQDDSVLAMSSHAHRYLLLQLPPCWTSQRPTTWSPAQASFHVATTVTFLDARLTLSRSKVQVLPPTPTRPGPGPAGFSCLLA